MSVSRIPVLLASTACCALLSGCPARPSEPKIECSSKLAVVRSNLRVLRYIEQNDTEYDESKILRAAALLNQYTEHGPESFELEEIRHFCGLDLAGLEEYGATH